MNNPPDFIRQLDGQFKDGIIRSRKPVYHPLPSEKIGKGAVCREGGGGDCTEASLRRVKTANNKIPLSSIFNDSEGLHGTTVCRCLVRRPHYSARLMRFGSRGPSAFATEMP